MERKFYHTDFEELIKEKADQYKMYPSDRVWKGINKALRSRRKWYWSGFVLLLSGVSYLAITELVTPSPAPQVKKAPVEAPKPQTTAQLHPFNTPVLSDEPIPSPADELTSDFTILDDGNVTAAFEIPLKMLPGTVNLASNEKASVMISGLEPLDFDEQYNIELSWPVQDARIKVSTDALKNNYKGKVILHTSEDIPESEKMKINWLTDNVAYKYSTGRRNRISWQLAFAPTVNYRKLTGGSRTKFLSNARPIPLAVNIDGDIDNLVNHKPALGFELGTHGLLKLNNRFTFKAGLQFNYSKYDIRAFKAPGEMATIALNSQTGINPIVGYSDLRNFGGTSPEEIKNQYFQLSVPVGFEYKIFGEDRLQFKVASTIQPTYLLNSNTYLITTDFKNYAKKPDLVRKWNVNAGAEAYISYDRGGVVWQVGPQFRYQLLSSYKKEYPIKEYLMEYGIKVGITKTIR